MDVIAITLRTLCAEWQLLKAKEELGIHGTEAGKGEITGETNMAEIGTTPGCATDAYGVCTSCDPCEPTYSLDATASTDADEDLLWYVFSGQKVSGDGGTLEITANGDGTASVSFSMSVGCAPDSSTGLYEVEVEVHDCNGVTDTAAVQIAYTCQSQ